MYLVDSPIPNHPKEGKVLFLEEGDEDFPGEILKLAPRITDNEGNYLYFVVFHTEPRCVYDFTKAALRASLAEIRARKSFH